MQNDPSNPDAYPVMLTFNMWGGWSVEEWMQWHGAMKTAYGLETANRNFLIAWGDDGVFSGPPLDARSFNTAFREYAKANGFFDGLYHGLGVLAKPLGAGADVLDAASNAAGNIARGVENTSKAANWLVPLALAGVALYIAAPIAIPAAKKLLK